MDLRIAIAALMDAHSATVLHRLRSRFDPRTAAAIVPHITLLGPAEVDSSNAAVRRTIEAVEKMARRRAPLQLTADRPDTFVPSSNTAFLRLAPDGLLTDIHDELYRALLWRERYPYVPHLTIAEYLGADDTMRVRSHLMALDVRVHLRIDRFGVFTKLHDEAWGCQREVPLGAWRER